MTVPYHYEESDHHIRMTATMAAFVAILVAVAGLTIWQAGFDGGGSTTDRSTVEVQGGERTLSPASQGQTGYTNPSLAGAGARYGVTIAPSEWSLPDVNEIRSFPNGPAVFGANGGPGGHSLGVPDGARTSPAQALADFGTPEAAGGLPYLPTFEESTPNQAINDYPNFGLAESQTAQQLDCSYWSVCDDGPNANPNAGSRVQ